MVDETNEDQLLTETAIGKAAALYLIARLNKNFRDWDAYKAGLIDDRGNILRDPETNWERQALDSMDKIVIIIKQHLPSSALRLLSAYSVFKILAEDEIEEKSLKHINEVMLPTFLSVISEANVEPRDALRWLLDKAITDLAEE
jgi:hypothetical protein